MKKFDYLVITKNYIGQAFLRECGVQGWELVNIIPHSTYTFDYIFKREIEETENEKGLK